jgi:hypothetical protein
MAHRGGNAGLELHVPPLLFLDTTLGSMQVTRALESHQIVDKNGVLKTVWKKPASAPPRKSPFPVATVTSPLVSPRQEQQVIFEELSEALKDDDSFRLQHRLVRIEALHSNKKNDSRLLFKTFLVAGRGKHPLHFVEEVHSVLIEHGTNEPHLIINENNLDAIHEILRATGNTYVPSKRKTSALHIREFINHALTCGLGAETVLQIIAERHPQTTSQLKELSSEYQRSTRPIQHGAL